MNTKNYHKLEEVSLKVRENILDMTQNGGCFIGASNSCVELLVYLYYKFLNLSLENLKHPTRNYLFLSKGHAVPALYSVFIELGWLKKERLKNHLKINDFIYWHPNRNIPGIEFHSGSLGHALPLAVGVALDCKLKNQNNYVVVLTGDGELNEGTNWEALLVAQAYNLNNLIVIVDRNQFQANTQTENLIPLEPLEAKFQAFGCNIKRGDGHSFEWLDSVFKTIPYSQDKPNVIIANTIRGKGITGLEKDASKWFCNFNEEQIESYKRQLQHYYKEVDKKEKVVA